MNETVTMKFFSRNVHLALMNLQALKICLRFLN